MRLIEKITIHVPHQAVRLEFVEKFCRAYFSDEIPVLELLSEAPFDDTVEAVDTKVEEIVCFLAVMLCITGETFAIFEDKSYHIGETYGDNVSGRLELDEYIYITIEP